MSSLNVTNSLIITVFSFQISKIYIYLDLKKIHSVIILMSYIFNAAFVLLGIPRCYKVNITVVSKIGSSRSFSIAYSLLFFYQNVSAFKKRISFLKSLCEFYHR